MHNRPHTEESKRKISLALAGTHREQVTKFGEGIYKDTGCELSTKCTECPTPLSRCPLEMESKGWIQGQLRPDVVRKLTLLRLAEGGDVCDEGSPANLRWKKSIGLI